jgi:hypothetical protein
MNAASYDLKKTQQAKDSAVFWIVSHSTALTDALYALYYLPMSYKLLVLDDANAQNIENHTEVIDRVQFASTERSGAAPFSFAHAVISKQAGENELLVSMSNPSTPEYGFRIAAGSPEALASAIHKVARAIP